MKENGSNKELASVELEKSAKSRKKEIKASEPQIYIGPRFDGMVSGTVFKNGRPPVLEAAVQAFPVMAELIVPVSQLVRANKELNKPDSALKRFYQMAETHIHAGLNGKKGV